ncbi:class I SAM-dependent methyltransferase [Bacillus salacetis]|uniref:Class I SAM-dependent methyltransferase n=1 Tax=Bacillus salacetis TaxID=2315464 RepID=A0A3A1QNF7_9BACI|nr:class I SAM-dependent methyltransferase [Bacillus salacetis]RIW27429.1 class I SAM-dependent methyltransferase [Bacillus salacetis]
MVQKASYESQHYNRYEPTPYPVLERLFDYVELEQTDRIVDFGCGTGRLNFYVHHRFQPTVVGVEMNEFYYHVANENKNSYLGVFGFSESRIIFENSLAQDYAIHPRDNVFYFFNPFSIQIFINVINNIVHSFEEESRDIQLILYYAPEDYVFFLENKTAFQLKREIPLPGNVYEKFLIYSLEVIAPTRKVD